MLECEYLCRNILYIFGWHTRVYRDGEIVLDLPPKEILFDPASPFADELLENKRSCFVKLCASNRFFIVLSSPKDSARILIGPVGSSAVSLHTAQNELYEYGVYDELLEEYFAYRNAASCFSHSRLGSIATTLQYALSGEKDEAFETAPAAQIIAPADLEKSDENISEIIAFECEYLMLIETGNKEKLNSLLTSTPYWNNLWLVYGTALLPLKSKTASYILLASRAAMRAGVGLELAYERCEMFITQTDSATSAREVLAVFRSASLFFADAVASLSGSQLANRVREYVINNFDRRTDTEELADIFGLSRPYFCKKFKEETGKTPAQYVLELKLEQAVQLLERSGTPLAQISDRLGFSSQSHFQNSFKKHFGETPAQYRERIRSENIYNYGKNITKRPLENETAQ